jgi:hypothetical protein
LAEAHAATTGSAKHSPSHEQLPEVLEQPKVWQPSKQDE